MIYTQKITTDKFGEYISPISYHQCDVLGVFYFGKMYSNINFLLKIKEGVTNELERIREKHS